MTSPTPLPTGPPPAPQDRFGRDIKKGDALAWGAGDGYLNYGVVHDIIDKWDRIYYGQRWDWTSRVKCRSDSSGWSQLTKFRNVIILDGEAADLVRKKVNDYWEKNG